MANYILCYHTGSGVIQRVVNADVVNFEKCGLSDKETKIQISDSSENVGYYLGRRYSGSADDLANGNGTMVLQDSFEWSINGLVLSSSMDVSIPSDSPFNLELKVLDGQTNEKSNISGDGSTDYVSVKPIWHIESLIAPDDEESLASYDIPNANMEYQPYTNGEATQSVDLTSDSNRLYLLRTSNVSVNLIKD